MRVAHIAWTFGLNGIPEPRGKPWAVNVFDPGHARRSRVCSPTASAARRAGADVVIASVHCCTEYQADPDTGPAQDRRRAARLPRRRPGHRPPRPRRAAAGADQRQMGGLRARQPHRRRPARRPTTPSSPASPSPAEATTTSPPPPPRPSRPASSARTTASSWRRPRPATPPTGASSRCWNDAARPKRASRSSADSPGAGVGRSHISRSRACPFCYARAPGAPRSGHV